MKLHELEKQKHEAYLKKYRERMKSITSKNIEMTDHGEVLDRREAFLQGKVEHLKRVKEEERQEEEGPLGGWGHLQLRLLPGQPSWKLPGTSVGTL